MRQKKAKIKSRKRHAGIGLDSRFCLDFVPILSRFGGGGRRKTQHLEFKAQTRGLLASCCSTTTITLPSCSITPLRQSPRGRVASLGPLRQPFWSGTLFSHRRPPSNANFGIRIALLPSRTRASSRHSTLHRQSTPTTAE